MKASTRILVAAVGALLVTMSSGSPAQQLYSLTDLGSLGRGVNALGAINASGQVAGSSAVSGSCPICTSNLTQHAFLFSGGTMQDIGTLGGNYSSAFGLNDLGQVTGMSYVSPNLGAVDYHAFVYSNGTMTDIGTLGGAQSAGLGINNKGQVTGWSLPATGSDDHVFLYSNGTMQDLGPGLGLGINASGQITGASSGRAFIYSDGVMHDIGTLGSSGSNSAGFAINASGQVAGFSNTADPLGPLEHAFLYSEGTMHDLGTLGGYVSYAWGINAQGQVVGSSFVDGFGAEHAFLYSGGAMHDLNTLLTGDLAPYITLSSAFGINDSGWIVALGFDSRNGNPAGAYLLTPVPELETAWLLLAGLGAVGIAARRRRFSRTAT
jgi:probable HAF family extracellular repeat protein